MNIAVKVRLGLMAGLLALALAGPAANMAFGADGPHDHNDHNDRRGIPERNQRDSRDHNRGQFFDRRYNHGRYYPQRGMVMHALPPGYRSYYHGGQRFFFAGGVWYASGPGGYIVTVPPRGLVVSVLPPFYTTLSFGGVPYYYADDVYYQWNAGASAYVVVNPPTGADQSVQPEQAPPAQAPQEELYIYPKNGQPQAQQDKDRYECHSWSAGQTGFDPTQPGGGVSPDQNASKREQYRRAMTACLDARGYSVQ